MLSAGLIDCIFAIVHHLTLLAFTKQLLLVLVIFTIIGTILKWILDFGLKKMADKEEELPQEEETTEEQKEGTLENIDAKDAE
jgi:ABC-type bacteriocin/lantibiotic exporter with double-glycine peptidase domain